MRLFLPLLTVLMAWPLADCRAVRSYLPTTVDPMVEPWHWQTLEELEGLRALCMEEAPDGSIWFGNMGGIDRYDGLDLKVIPFWKALLSELGIYDNTYFIVVSDNGYRHDELLLEEGLTQPLHSRKWWLWDGGIRAPMIVKGSGIAQGSFFQGNVVNYDFPPTFFEWAGGDSKTLRDIDGVSLKGYMEGRSPGEGFLNRNLYFHFSHYRSSVPHSAIVSGPNKVMHFYYAPDIPLLFDTSKDPGEMINIAKQNPELQKNLFVSMRGYLTAVGARFPKSNPAYNAARYKKDRKTRERLQWGAFEGTRPLEKDEQ